MVVEQNNSSLTVGLHKHMFLMIFNKKQSAAAGKNCIYFPHPEIYLFGEFHSWSSRFFGNFHTQDFKKFRNFSLTSEKILKLFPVFTGGISGIYPLGRIPKFWKVGQKFPKILATIPEKSKFGGLPPKYNNIRKFSGVWFTKCLTILAGNSPLDWTRNLYLVKMLQNLWKMMCTRILKNSGPHYVFVNIESENHFLHR